MKVLSFLVQVFVVAIASAVPLTVSAQQSGEVAARAGDEGMTCEAIVAEIRTLQVTGISAETSAEAQAAAEAMRDEQNRQQAAAAGQMMAGAASTAGSSVAAAGGFHGANQALLAGQIAAQGDGMRNAARMQPLQDRTVQANAAAMAELQESIQANPRFGRLIQLAGARGCSGDF